MKRLIAYVLSTLAISVCACVPVHAQTKSLRHLVYAFSVGQQGDQHDTDSASGNSGGPNGAPVTGSGSTDYNANVSDKGTISIDVMGIQPDKGLVVTVSEAGQNGRNAAADTCVVFANTSTTCQNPQGVNPEEISVIRLLAPHFYDPSQLDAKQHWHEGGASKEGSTSIDFTVTKNVNDMLTISEHRRVTQTGIGAMTVNADSTILYDVKHFVPTSIKEYSTLHKQQPAGGYFDQTSDTELTLQSDSMNKN
ncbi:MAG: hypothetical protein ACYDGM_11200 [Vulcanimicrobiaceae bacterium]